MRMNPGIILSADQPDMVNTLARSNVAAAQSMQNTRTNKMNNVLAQHGAGLVAGDKGALNALAALDPAAAMGLQSERLNQQMTQKRMAALDAQERRSLEAHVAQMDAATRAAEARQIEGGIVRGIAAYKAGDLAGVNAILTAAGEQPIQSLEMFPAVAARYGNVLDILKSVDEATAAPEPGYKIPDGYQLMDPARPHLGVRPILGYEAPEPKPTNDYERYAARQKREGRVPMNEFEYRAEVAKTNGPQTVVNFGFNDGATGDTAEPTTPITSDLPDGAGRESFGLLGAGKNLWNSVTDAIAGVETFPEVGEATRFFRSLEEEGLVGLAQAYPRQPANQLMERLRKLLPNVGTLEGAQAAYRELAQMRARFERDLKNAKRTVGRGSVSHQAEAASRILALEGLIQQADEGLRLLAPPNEQILEISPDVADRLKAYE